MDCGAFSRVCETKPSLPLPHDHQHGPAQPLSTLSYLSILDVFCQDSFPAPHLVCVPLCLTHALAMKPQMHMLHGCRYAHAPRMHMLHGCVCFQYHSQGRHPEGLAQILYIPGFSTSGWVTSILGLLPRCAFWPSTGVWFCFVWAKVLLSSTLVLNSLCIPSLPWTHNNPASVLECEDYRRALADQASSGF